MLLCYCFTALKANSSIVSRFLFTDDSVTDLALIEGFLKQTLTALHPLELNLLLKLLLLQELIVLAINLLSRNQVLNRDWLLKALVLRSLSHTRTYLSELRTLLYLFILLFPVDISRHIVEQISRDGLLWSLLFLLLLRRNTLCDALLQNFHDVEVLVFEVNAFALEVAANQFFLFFDGLRFAVHFLEEYLHEINLAECKLAHFFNYFGLFMTLDWRFKTN